MHCHPMGAGKMAVMDLPRALRLGGGIQAKHHGGDLGPVCTVLCGVKYP